MSDEYKRDIVEQLNKKYDIDVEKLTRDYANNPIKLPNRRNLIVRPSEDDLKFLYIEKNMILNDLALYIGLKKCGLTYILRKYGLKKPSELLTRSNKTACEKYATFILLDSSGNKVFEGLLHPHTPKGGRPDSIVKIDDIYQDYIVENMSIEEVAEKYHISKEQVRVTLTRFLKVRKDPIKAKEVTARNLYKKYGVVNVFQMESIKEKSKKTTIERYGVDRYSKTKEYVGKVRATKLERYGRENYTNTEKGVQTMRKNRYTPEQLAVVTSAEAFKQYVVDNNIQNAEHMASVLGVSAPVLCRLARKFGCKGLFDYSKSRQEQEVQEFIRGLLPNDDVRFNVGILDRKEVDVYIATRNVGVEYNGCNWHNAAHHVRNYHRLKSIIAGRKGIDLIHIFDYQWLYRRQVIEDIIRHRFGLTSKKLGARKCSISPLDGERFDRFVEENSLYHPKHVEKDVLGLIYDDRLVLGVSYCLKGKFVEILEMQGKLGYCIQGGISRLLTAIERRTGCRCFQMNFNFTAFSGNTFKKLGWTFGERLPLRRTWVKYKTFFDELDIPDTVKVDIGYEVRSSLKVIRSRLRERYYHEIYDCGEIFLSKDGGVK